MGPGSLRQLSERVPAPVKGLAKRVVVSSSFLWDPVYIAAYRRRSGNRRPIPPFANRRRVAAWRLPYFFASGVANHADLMDAFRRFVPDDLATLTVLDLACGPGRIAQYFDGHFKDFTVSDVDASAVRFLGESFPSLHAAVNNSVPPLPFEDSQFDLVYSWSLWTHLPEPMQERYLEDLHRIVKPGGWAFVTTNGHGFLDEYHRYPRAESWWLGVSHDDLARQGVVFKEYVLPQHDRDTALAGISSSFGLTFNDPAQIKSRWSHYFEVVAVEEGLSNHQDMVVLRHRG